MKNHQSFYLKTLRQILDASKILTVLFILAVSSFVYSVDGDVDTSFQGSALKTGIVYASAIQPDGKVIIGGDFYAVNGVPRRAIARLNTDGSIDTTFQPNVSGTVRSIVLQPNGQILVGGGVALNLPTRQRLNFFRLNADGTSDDNFNTGEGVTSGSVYSIAQQPNGQILLGGDFDGFNGFFRSGILRINYDGTRDFSFEASAYGDSANEGVYGIALQSDGKIIIVGDFTYANNQPKSGIARLNPDGTLDNVFTGSVTTSTRYVFGVAVQPDNKIIVCGFFNQINGVTKNKIARLNSDGSLDTSFGADIPTALYTARTVKLQADGKILIGGSFSQINGIPKSNVARLFSNGTLDTSFNAGTNSAVYDIIPSDNPLIVGFFTKLNNIESFGVSRTDSSGNRDNSFNVGIGNVGVVNKIVAQPDGKFIIGGDFTHFVNSSRSNIARLNNDGTIDHSFNPGTGFTPGTGFGSGPQVRDIALLSGSRIAVAGNFSSYNGVTQQMLVVLNPDGSRDTSFNPNFTQSGDIRKVFALPGGRLLIFGSFRFGSETQGVTLALLNADGSRDTSFVAPTFAPTPGSLISVTAQPDGKIIVVGSFSSVNGTPKNYIARLNQDGTLDNTLTLNVPDYTQSYISNAYVQTDGKILVFGPFRSTAPQSFSGVGLLRLNPDGTRDLSFNAPPGRSIDESTFTVQPDGRILILMTYSFEYAYFNPVNKRFVARLRPNGTLDYAFNFNFRGINYQRAESIFTVAVAPDQKVLIGGNFAAYSDTPRLSLARLENSTQPNAAFDFEGDGRTDVSIFRPSVGQWWINRSISGQTFAAQFGNSNDNPVPADFTGDNHADIAFFRPSTGEWFILRSENNTFYAFPFGSTGDIPVRGDFDGDGKFDATVFRPSNGTWYIQKSMGGTLSIPFGTTGDIPVPADYDGDDRTDLAIYRPSNGQWWLYRSSLGRIALTFGTSTDLPVPGDYTGDCQADIAFFRPSTGEWFVIRSEDNTFYGFPFGMNGDIPASGDYDGDGRADAAVFRPSNGSWYLLQSTGGFTGVQFGITGDIPLPATFVP